MPVHRPDEDRLVLIDGGALGIEQRDLPRDGPPRRIRWSLQLPVQALELLPCKGDGLVVAGQWHPADGSDEAEHRDVHRMVFLSPVTSLAIRHEIEPGPVLGAATEVVIVKEDEPRAVPYLPPRSLAKS